MLVVLVAGAVNMLMLKFQHMQAVPTRDGGPMVKFDHPAVQAGLLMVGNFMCLPIYYLTRSPEDAERSRHLPKWIFLVPCCCDLLATGLLCTGLAYVAVSVAQMCRGTVVVFACALSAVFLGRRQYGYHLTGVAMVLTGIIVVSLSVLSAGTGRIFSISGQPHMASGIGICIFAQIFQASMFVYEESIMEQYPVPPLQVVGMEGLCGVIVSGFVLATLYRFGLDDPFAAFYQICHSPALAASVFGSMSTAAMFNTAGATVTQRSSATARTTIKISATVLIWMVELACGWNKFCTLQFAGFSFVVAGTLVYNKILIIPGMEPTLEQQALLQQKDGMSPIANFKNQMA
eukprot:TRINITY_DN36015_c0_g1_i1.p1 TRINITY_DN36015_c0_g1~~TRINITY_DN36015_c0_g1_i1.p1  ORF type:complete len:379 (+),score=64.65 TRINITY_DN36015_c0_g1_i1:100-1137(+)